MFWTNTARPPRIERAALDGTNHITLFSTELGSLNAIAVDPGSELLFWADCDLKRIEMARFDGSNRRMLLEAYKAFRQLHGLAVFGEHIYWVDRDMQMIERVNKTNGRQRTMVKSRVSQLSDITAATPLRPEQLRRHPCYRDNGGCSHLCVAEPGGRRCSCPVALMLAADERACVEPPTCHSTEFTCSSGECLPLHFHCDGSNDCKDKSDERDCRLCENTCRDGQCMASGARCDGKADCGDGSDEIDCAVCDGQDAYQCAATGQCITLQQRCNQHVDCPRGDDESDCPVAPFAPAAVGASANVKYIIIGVILCVLLTFTILPGIVFCRRHRRHRCLECPPAHDVFIASKVPPRSSSSRTHSRSVKATRSSAAAAPTAAAAAANYAAGHSTSSTLYDRAHVTGASSSSSTMAPARHYPYETLNPPPSPVTERSLATYYSSTSAASSYRPPLPPTPCSTDVCEDSEPYGKYYNAGIIDYDEFDSLVCSHAPCPTPHSHYLSDSAVASCPPSPLTDRSCFNPPPPSPVGTSEC